MAASGLRLLWSAQHVHNRAAISMDRWIIVGTHGGFDDVIACLFKTSCLISHYCEHVVRLGRGDICFNGVPEPYFGFAHSAVF